MSTTQTAPTFRAIFSHLLAFVFLTAFSAWAAASSLTGIWSSSTGGYLVMLEQSSGGGMVVLQVDPALASGKAYTGSRSGDTVTVSSLDQSASLSLAVSGTTYSGNLTQGGATQPVSGGLLFAYVGGTYDGIWQRNDATGRYLVVVTATINQASAMVLVDARIDPVSYAATYDVALGTLAATNPPSLIGASLISGNTVKFAFQGGEPQAATYTVTTASLPRQTVETFSTTQIFAVGSSSASLSQP